MERQRTILPTGWLNTDRRHFLRAVGVGLGLGPLLAANARAEQGLGAAFRPLDEKTHLDIGDQGPQMIETAYKLGYDFEKKHGGCARCTVAAVQQALEFVPNDPGLFRAATCLDGGATPTGKQNCGGFTGAGIVIGYTCGTEDFKGTALAHKLIREVCKHFEQEYGTVLCEDVRKKGKADCPEIVGKATRWTAEVLLRQFTDYGSEVSS